jgi:hypothetical protein
LTAWTARRPSAARAFGPTGAAMARANFASAFFDGLAAAASLRNSATGFLAKQITFEEARIKARERKAEAEINRIRWTG